MKRQGLPEVRPWKIFSIKSSHTDIGLHNSQYIQRHGSVKHIRDAAALVDADQRADTDPAAYRYIMEGFWVWHNYPMDIFGLKINGPIKDMADVIQKTATGLKTLEERYPYDIWLAANYDDDEPANTQLADFASALEDRGITMDGHRLSYHIRLAEYSGLLCSGDLLPLRHSYALSPGHNPRRGGAESGNGSLHPLFQHVFMTFATHSF